MITIKAVTELNPFLQLSMTETGKTFKGDREVKISYRKSTTQDISYFYLPQEVLQCEEAVAFLIDEYLREHFPTICQMIEQPC